MIGKNINNLLYSKHKTQTWLAKECGVTKGHINQIIKGKAKPSLHLLMEMSKILNASVDELIDD